jgi:hypothetical protein
MLANTVSIALSSGTSGREMRFNPGFSGMSKLLTGVDEDRRDG